ncbi:MAG: hypothetical protein QOI64_263 [Solirubrobacteraceae bacterium]|nr:hypothetical protein [Solirubrobacteraceae bacterium]
MDLADATHSTFSERVGDVFTLEVDDLTLELTLDAADARAADARAAPADPEARTPFSLVFSAPADRPLDQGMYPIGHPELGVLDMFIVPIGRDENGTRYEAVFA